MDSPDRDFAGLRDIIANHAFAVSFDRWRLALVQRSDRDADAQPGDFAA